MGRGIRRSVLGLAVSFAALAVALIVALPAAAEPPAEPGDGVMVVRTSSGGITTTQWFVNGELRASTVEILTADGLFQSTIRLFPDGNLSSVETRSVNDSSEFTTVQSFTRNGALQREITQEKQDGALVSETMTIFDGKGMARVHRTRTLVTHDDGTQAWRLTTQTFTDGQPVTRQDVEIPFHPVSGRPLMNQPIAPPGLLRQQESAIGETVGASSTQGSSGSNDSTGPGRGLSSEHRRDR